MTQQAGKVHFATIGSFYYTFMVVLFVSAMLIANLTAGKGVGIGPFTLDGAFYIFPLAYIIGDLITEVYGFKAMIKAIWTGFAMMLLASICFTITIWLPAADFYPYQKEISLILGASPIILFGSFMGYAVGETFNSFILVRIKQRTGEKQFWKRLLFSSLVGEFLDTLVFCVIVSHVIGISKTSDLMNYIGVGFTWKMLVEILCMPITCQLASFLKKKEPSYYRS